MRKGAAGPQGGGRRFGSHRRRLPPLAPTHVPNARALLRPCEAVPRPNGPCLRLYVLLHGLQGGGSGNKMRNGERRRQAGGRGAAGALQTPRRLWRRLVAGGAASHLRHHPATHLAVLQCLGQQVAVVHGGHCRRQRAQSESGLQGRQLPAS